MIGLLDIARPVRLRARAAETVAWFCFGGERDDWSAPRGLSPMLWLGLSADARGHGHG